MARLEPFASVPAFQDTASSVSMKPPPLVTPFSAIISAAFPAILNTVGTWPVGFHRSNISKSPGSGMLGIVPDRQVGSLIIRHWNTVFVFQARTGWINGQDFSFRCSDPSTSFLAIGLILCCICGRGNELYFELAIRKINWRLRRWYSPPKLIVLFVGMILFTQRSNVHRLLQPSGRIDAAISSSFSFLYTEIIDELSIFNQFLLHTFPRTFREWFFNHRLLNILAFRICFSLLTVGWENTQLKK